MPVTSRLGSTALALPGAARALWERAFPRAHNSYRGVHATFEEARKAAPRHKPLGYDAADAVAWYRDKLERITLEDYPMVYWLRSAFETGRRVFEIGGHVGVAYYGYATVLAYPPDLTWTIWDVPSVAAAGAALARERGRTNVSFVTDPRACDGADIVLASGSLQYIDSPTLPELLASFRDPPRHVLVNSTPVHEGPSFVTLQYLGSAYCPYRIFGRKDLVGALEHLGYRLVDTWQKPRAVRIPGHPEHAFEHYSGFYFVRSRR